mmetsp:Transcript_5231/g.7235  ORF Transcript_5231/g.7235 Transcript_5231/m.7235 type:complete len:452 (+) Transcript_5231:297-1652(+)
MSEEELGLIIFLSLEKVDLISNTMGGKQGKVFVLHPSVYDPSKHQFYSMNGENFLHKLVNENQFKIDLSQPECFEAGEQVLYCNRDNISGNGAVWEDATVIRVNHDDVCSFPYYTIILTRSGRNKHTVAAKLRKKNQIFRSDPVSVSHSWQIITEGELHWLCYLSHYFLCRFCGTVNHFGPQKVVNKFNTFDRLVKHTVDVHKILCVPNNCKLPLVHFQVLGNNGSCYGYRCNFHGCTTHSKTFKSQSSFSNHMRQSHKIYLETKDLNQLSAEEFFHNPCWSYEECQHVQHECTEDKCGYVRQHSIRQCMNPKPGKGERMKRRSTVPKGPRNPNHQINAQITPKQIKFEVPRKPKVCWERQPNTIETEETDVSIKVRTTRSTRLRNQIVKKKKNIPKPRVKPEQHSFRNKKEQERFNRFQYYKFQQEKKLKEWDGRSLYKNRALKQCNWKF